MPIRVPILTLLLSTLAWGQVRDSAGVFSGRAVDEAETIIRQIRQQTGRDLLVEVLPGVPALAARDRLEELRINGVYVLITCNPLHLDIAVSPETQQKAFTLDDAIELRTLMLGLLRKGQFDQALLTGAHFVLQTMQRNLPAGDRPWP